MIATLATSPAPTPPPQNPPKFKKKGNRKKRLVSISFPKRKKGHTKMFPPRLELGTFSVLDWRDDQLHHGNCRCWGPWTLAIYSLFFQATLFSLLFQLRLRYKMFLWGGILWKSVCTVIFHNWTMDWFRMLIISPLYRHCSHFTGHIWSSPYSSQLISPTKK